MNEGPYELPAGWRWVRLGEVCLINPRRPSLELKPSTPTTFVPMAAVDDKLGQIVSPEVKPFVQVKKGYTYFIDGDVLFAKITPCMENGKSAIARKLVNGFGFGSTEFHILRPSSALISEWIWFFVRRAEFRKAARNEFRGGVGQQRVPAEFLRETFVPLPPLEEQRRIVARIEELMERVREARRLRQNALEDTDRLWQSVLSETFLRPGTELPAGWRWVQLGDGFVLYQPNTVTIKQIKSAPGPYPVFGANGIIGHYSKYNHEEPEVIVTCRGATCGEVNISQPMSWITGNAMVVEPISVSVDKQYLFYCLKAADLGLAISGSAQPQITKAKLSKVFIPLPPLEEQRQIVDCLESVQEKIKAIKKAQERTEGDLRLLEQSILDRAFRGEL